MSAHWGASEAARLTQAGREGRWLVLTPTSELCALTRVFTDDHGAQVCSDRGRLVQPLLCIDGVQMGGGRWCFMTPSIPDLYIWYAPVGLLLHNSRFHQSQTGPTMWCLSHSGTRTENQVIMFWVFDLNRACFKYQITCDVTSQKKCMKPCREGCFFVHSFFY